MYQKEQWQDHWTKNELPWRNGNPDAPFIKALPELGRRFQWERDARAFVPLCGDSDAVLALVSAGLSTVALDFVPDAITVLAQRIEVEAHRPLEKRPPHNFSAPGIELLAQDIFEIEYAGEFSVVYDRGALVALPRHERERYARIISQALAPGGIVYLVTTVFDDTVVSRPPYSVSRQEIAELYPDLVELSCDAQELSEVPPRLAEAGVRAVTALTTLLQKKR